MNNTIDISTFNKEKDLIKNLRKLFLNYPHPAVTLICSTCKPLYINNIFNNYARINYPKKELIIILNNNSISLNKCILKAQKYENIQILQLDETCSLGECLNYAIKKSKYDYIAKIDDDDYYGINYLMDQMNVFNYTDADLIGKLSYFVYFEDLNTLTLKFPNNEFCYILDEASCFKGMSGGSILFKKEIFKKVKFEDLNIKEDLNFFYKCYKEKFKIYSSDKYNYVAMRHKNMENHTWQINSSEYLNLFGNYLTKILTIPTNDYFQSIVDI